MNHRIILVGAAIIIAITLISILNIGTSAHDGGKGDMTKEYNCVNSCHRTPSVTGTINIESSVSEVTVSKELTITVTVSNTEQAPGNIIGVFLVTAKAAEGSIPQELGWEILTDPNGGTNNYVEKPADASGEETFIWKLKAPDSPGEFTFYSREDHGNGDKYFKDTIDGIQIKVLPDPAAPTGPGDGQNGNPSDGQTDQPDDDTGVKSEEPSRVGVGPFDDEIVTDERNYMPLIIGIIIAVIIIIITQLMRR